MIQRRAAAGYTAAQVDLLGVHLLRSGFVTEAFRAGADAHSIMRQTGHRDPKMLEVYAPLVMSAAETDAGEPASPGPAYDWVAANRKKKKAIAQLASLSATMDDVDARINALIERTRDLELD